LSSGRYFRDEEVGDASEGTPLYLTFAGRDVFPAMGIDVVEGRVLGPDDLELGLTNVVINESASEILWLGESPLGRRIRSQLSSAHFTVVGVVENALQYDLRDSPLPIIYFPLVGPTPTSRARRARARRGSASRARHRRCSDAAA
jgi:hypothetical protein